MLFREPNNPATYLAETTQYVSDLKDITALRDKCRNLDEKAEYDNIIYCMQEVLHFMNTLSHRDRNRMPKAVFSE